MEPLKIGVLGAARIAPGAIVEPAHEIGARLVVVGARDPLRAREFAEIHAFERSAGSYQEVIEDPEVEVIYNPLPNALHAPWNLKAIAAGKHVLSEKPFASNGPEARRVHEAGLAAGVRVVDAFHYRYHPLMLRMLELVESGALGEILEVRSNMVMPPPPKSDVRWDAALAGGSLMDVGCYAVHAARSLGTLLGGAPVIVTASGGEEADAPGVDAWIDIEIAYPNGTTGLLRSSMLTEDRDFSLTVVGSKGTAFAPDFVLPHVDDRIVITDAAGRREEHLGRRPSYSYQLEAMTGLVRGGVPVPTDSADAVAQMEFIDAAYVSAGMSPRRAGVSNG